MQWRVENLKFFGLEAFIRVFLPPRPQLEIWNRCCKFVTGLYKYSRVSSQCSIMASTVGNQIWVHSQFGIKLQYFPQLSKEAESDVHQRWQSPCWIMTFNTTKTRRKTYQHWRDIHVSNVKINLQIIIFNECKSAYNIIFCNKKCNPWLY